MHVDGFRFDLASVLTRGAHGEPLPNPPVIWDIETDPRLAGVKLMAEAWDAAGLYQVGRFVGDAWMEWNGRFRDDVRSFVKSDPGFVTAFAERLTGSPDVYGQDGREPEQSVNFVTVHDGFTLNDLVSYDVKHNAANGERDRDGTDDNRSWNCGVEGPTDDPAVEALRNRQVKNFLALVLTAIGTPLLQMGDEVRRTQRGNNNAYCQDNEVSWLDWTLLERHPDVHRFVRELIAIRLGRSAGRRSDDTLQALLRRARVTFHDVRLGPPDTGRESHSLAMASESGDGAWRLYLMVNAWWEPLAFTLPPLAEDGRWRRWLDTSQPSPDDIQQWSDAPFVTGATYPVGPRSVAAVVYLGPGG